MFSAPKKKPRQSNIVYDSICYNATNNSRLFATICKIDWRNNLCIFQIPEDINIEQARRSLQTRPADPAAPPTLIMPRFLDAAVKDFPPELQKTWAKDHSVIKQLNEKAGRPRVFIQHEWSSRWTRVKEYFPPWRELGIQVQCGEKEHIEEQLTEGWNYGFKRDLPLNCSFVPHVKIYTHYMLSQSI